MADPEIQNADQQQQPPVGLVPGAGAPTSPAGIVSGAPDLATAVSQAYLQHLASNQPPPTAAVQQQAAAKAQANAPVDTSQKPPMSTADKVSGVSDAVMGGLSDAAHASDTKGGWLTGIANTLNARQQRLAQQQKDQALVAKTQAETVLMHRNVYQQDEAIRQQSYAGNQHYVDTMAVNHDIESDVTQSDLQKKMQDKEFAATHYVRATTEQPVLDANGEPKKDKNGLPITQPLYTVVTRATKDGKPDDHTVTPEMSADLERLVGSKIPAGTKLTTDQFTALDGQVSLARNSVNILEQSSGKSLSTDQLKALRPYLNDPQIQAAVSHVPGNPYAGLKQYEANADDHIAALQQQQQKAIAAKDQNAYDAADAQIKEINQEKTKVTQFASQAITPKEVDEYDKKVAASNTGVAEFAKDPKTIQGHAEAAIAAAQDTITNTKDPAVKAQAQRVLAMATQTQKLESQNKIDTAVGEQIAKDNAAKVDNNPNGLSGAAFIATLPVGRANMIRSIAEGGLAVNASAFERSTAGKPNQLADDVYAAYPDFKPYLGQEWPKSYANYMINGVDHKKAVAFNTVMEHASRLFDNTTTEGVINPNSAAYQQRQEEMSFVSRELGNAVSSGVLAQSEAEEVRNAIQTNWPTLEAKREKVREAVRLLDSKMKAMQDGFDATSPSAAIKAPRLQSAAATAAHDHVLGLDQQQQQQQTTQGGGQGNQHPIGVQVPNDLKGSATATKQFKDPASGKVSEYWVGANGKPIRAVKPGELPQ